MSKKVVVALCLLAVIACKKKEEAPPPAPASTQTQAAATNAAPATTAQPTVNLPAGAPIPANGVALWLVADDVKPAADGKLVTWSNASVAGVTASADKPELQPTVVA